jgi:glycosyltransferase involved in cell wall biosynthesis
LHHLPNHDAHSDSLKPAAVDERSTAPRVSWRIAGVDPERGYGGGETQVLGLTKELLRMGHQAELFCDPEGQLWARALAAGIVCRPLRVRNAVDLRAGLRLRAMLTRESYDVVHFHTSRAHALAPYLGGVGAVRIVTRRMDYRPNRCFSGYLYNHAVDGVIAISEGVADALAAAGAGRQRIRVVPSGIDCAQFTPPAAQARAAARARLGLWADELVVGALGALVPRKGHRTLIEAIALARSRARVASTDRLRCLIAGAGPLAAELASCARDLGCHDCVRFLGHLERPRELLWALDLYAMPSISEGLGVAALEAMACGLPVVASAVGGLRECLEDGVSGVLVPANDPEQLAGALTTLAGSTERRTALGAAGRARVVERFSVAAMAQGTAQVYAGLLARRREDEFRKRPGR